MPTFALALCALAPLQDGQQDIWERLEFYANGRFRWESTFDQVNADDRHRGRMRFRVGAKYALTEDIALEARLSTASEGNDANNPHWDFGDGDGFNGGGLVFDRYFLDWTADPELHGRFGKMPHAFAQPPIFGDFIWDSDVSPAGAAAIWKPVGDSDVTFDLRGAGYVATEVTDGADPKMLGAQGNLYVPTGDAKLQFSSSLYGWMDLDQGTVVAGNQGNTDVTGDFTIWEGFVSGALPGGPLGEMTAYGQFMTNLAESDEDDGFVVGLQLGPNHTVGAYNLFLLYYDLDADCLFSPVAQDDTAIAGTGLGTGMNGVIVGWTYFWKDDVAFKLWALTSDAGASDDPFRIRFDLDFAVK